MTHPQCVGQGCCISLLYRWFFLGRRVLIEELRGQLPLVELFEVLPRIRVCLVSPGRIRTLELQSAALLAQTLQAVEFLTFEFSIWIKDQTFPKVSYRTQSAKCWGCSWFCSPRGWFSDRLRTDWHGFVHEIHEPCYANTCGDHHRSSRCFFFF